jgi:hypothetical protein
MIDHSLIQYRHSEFVAPWAEVGAWRKELHCDFERALAETNLSERPDYETAIRFLIKAVRETAQR